MIRLAWLVLFVAASIVAPAAAQQPPTQSGPTRNASLWSDPGNVRGLDLYWGPGGDRDQPRPPAEFLEEDLHGHNPKFDVRDSAGTKWHLKMGEEARPEVVASRLLWAIGYSANENYFEARLHVDHMPARLRRGQNLAGQGGDVPDVRLQRRPDDEKKVGNWNWRHNPFVGTREFNGLRVMMALLRNWDLYDDNNAVLESKHNPGQKIYQVTDVGTGFGSPGRRYGDVMSKGNLGEYRRGRFIHKITRDYVDFDSPKMPPLIYVFEIRFYVRQLRAHWIGKHIPRADAKWAGSLLAQLSPGQIRDAFRAAGYSQDLIDAYSATLISRIQELNQL